MRYASYYALAALLAVSTTACQKAGVEPTATGQGLLTGEWHWVASTGGFTGKQTYTPASTGATITWVFKSDNTYRSTTTQAGGAPVTDTGTFSLGSVKSIYSGQPAPSLTLRGKQSQTFLIQELTTRLVLADNAYDGFGHTYER